MAPACAGTADRWSPRPLAEPWTPDQSAIAAAFPQTRRLVVCAANGVGKTHVAADLAVSFLLDYPDALVILTAPTRRQVRQLLWPQVRRRLLALNLMEPGLTGVTESGCEWLGPAGQQLFGFVSNQAQRMQGYHAQHLLVLVDEASGMTQEMLEAIEGIAVAEENYVLAIGNPNDPSGPFWQINHSPSWLQQTISALTHPNIQARDDVIPGATTWRALLAHLADWCSEQPSPGPDTFSISVSPEVLAYPQNIPEQAGHLRHFLPNDAFRVRFLGWFPSTPTTCLLSPDQIRAVTDRPVSTAGRVLAALDIARTGGDSTVYAVRRGNAVTRIRIVQPANLCDQAEEVNRLLLEDNPEQICCDAAGLGIGLIDFLRRICSIPVKEFNGADAPISPLAARRFLNRRAESYGRFAEAVRKAALSLPANPDLSADLAAVTFRHTPEGQLLITPKDQLKAKTGRSPDRADAVTMLWAMPTIQLPNARRRRREEEDDTW